jgi:sugar transferase (PEP-CTERM/EpsH1 system associated)
MRILYLCHRVPYPPSKGDKIRAFHQIEALSAAHEVDLFTLADDPEDLQYRDALARFTKRLAIARIRPLWNRIRSFQVLGSHRPQTLPYFYSRELEREIRASLQERSYDRILVYCSSMFQYVEHVGAIPILTDLVDVDSNKWLQYASQKSFPLSAIYCREGRCLRRYERRVCEKSSCVVVTTEQEKRLIHEICSTARVAVISNGIDTGYFDPSKVNQEPPSPTVVFCGDMSYFPNEAAVQFFAVEVFPKVRESVPEARFLIVGRNPGPVVRNLARLAGIEVTGTVPDVRPYLARAAVSVAPFSIAAGIQNKILEAMAFGLPVISSSRAARGLPAGLGPSVWTADTAAELTAAIVPLLRDPILARRQGMDNRRLVAEYSWESALSRLIALVENTETFQAHPGSAFRKAESVRSVGN